MSRGVVLLVILFCVLGCSSKPGRTSLRSDQITPEGHAVIAKLPEGLEGIELASGGLRVVDGYDFVRDSDSTFAVTRKSDRHQVTQGGCGCNTSGGCEPTFTSDGIIVCKPTANCSDCGLALTAGGLRIEVVRY